MAVAQGLTEFLPVSSSGHLVILGQLLGLPGQHLLFDVVVHGGTLLAVLVFYRQALGHMLRETAAVLLARKHGTFVSAYAQSSGFRLAALVCAGTLPTGIIGLTFRAPLERLFSEPRAAAAMLLVTATALGLSRWVTGEGRGLEQMRLRDALVIGVVQGVAIIPGISRSGSTMVAALFLGLERELAARFSFMLAIPAIVGALVLQLFDGAHVGHIDAGPLWVGFCVSMVTGLGALALLIPIVRRGALHYFALYLVPVAVFGLVYLP